METIFISYHCIARLHKWKFQPIRVLPFVNTFSSAESKLRRDRCWISSSLEFREFTAIRFFTFATNYYSQVALIAGVSVAILVSWSKNMISAFPSISSGWQLKFPIQKICSIRGIPHFREWLHRDPVFTQNALQPLPLWWRRRRWTRRWMRRWMRRWTLDKEVDEDLDEEVDYICYL